MPAQLGIGSAQGGQGRAGQSGRQATLESQAESQSPEMKINMVHTHTHTQKTLLALRFAPRRHLNVPEQ